MATELLQKSPTDAKLIGLINDHFSTLPKTGDVVKGIVIYATKSEILIDIPGFTTGVVRGRELRNLPTEHHGLKSGAPVDAMVIDLENENGQMELSLKSAITESSWSFIKEKEENQEVLELRVSGANKGGLLTSIKSIPAFLPVSQLTPEHYPRVEGGDKKKILKKLKGLVGKILPVKIIAYSPEEQKIIVSEKRAWEETQKQKLGEYKIDDTITGKVQSVTNFGCFIRFAESLEGLIPISEISIPEGKTISEVVHHDQEIEAKIIDIRGTKVFLSLIK
ncbi:MAG: 30S ribosomal protein S1 [Candidatus Jacksonbacteria bacterium]|nr:30S ribosomal protein S1 [Candidatus Jacksonbacteria bacterium]